MRDLMKIILVEDDDVDAESIMRLIKKRDMKNSVLRASNGVEALALMHQNEASAQPYVVLMDINLGEGESGIDVVRQLKADYADILFMMCTVYEDDEKIFEALTAGASGYILKKTAPHKLLEAIRELQEGGAPMSSQIARKVVAAFQQKAATATAANNTLNTLSNREKEILELLAKGMLYKEIAASLFISQETVRKHVYHIYEKLHVNNRVEAINKFFGR